MDVYIYIYIYIIELVITRRLHDQEREGKEAVPHVRVDKTDRKN